MADELDRDKMQGLLVSAFGHLPCAAYRLLNVDDPVRARAAMTTLLPLVTTALTRDARHPARWVPLLYGWNTLGAAHVRAGDWKGAVVALKRSMDLRKGGDAHDWFFLAMAHWRAGAKDRARVWFDKAVAWTDANRPGDQELVRFRAEAEALMTAE